MACAWRATRAFAKRLKRWASPRSSPRLVAREEGTGASAPSSFWPDPDIRRRRPRPVRDRSIVFHIAEHHVGLFPGDANARARAITWMFAALNTAEPPILE